MATRDIRIVDAALVVWVVGRLVAAAVVSAGRGRQETNRGPTRAGIGLFRPLIAQRPRPR